MDVSVIIVNYKTSGLVADCIESILSKTKDINYEIIILDNNSEPDFDRNIISKIPDNPVIHINFVHLAENMGFGRACNEGIKIAKGRNILFLNPDTILLNNAIKILYDFHDNTKDAGACGGNLYNEKGEKIFSYRRFLPGLFWETDELLNNLPQKIRWGKNRISNHSERPIQTGYISGADLMVKKSVIDIIGGFHKEFFMFYEDTDICLRIQKEGYNVYNVPEAKIMHLSSKSFKAGEEWQSDTKTRLMEEGRKIYYKLNATKFRRKGVDIIYDIFLLTRIFFLRKGSKREYYKRRREYFRCKV